MCGGCAQHPQHSDAHEAQLLGINPSASARVYFLTYRGPPVFDGLALGVTQHKSTRMLITADCNGAATRALYARRWVKLKEKCSINELSRQMRGAL